MSQPKWQKPALGSQSIPLLYLNNTLTRRKEQFIPKSGGISVTWYNCGPTVYDASHMGHARTYITFDILRRVMEDYFSFKVFYVMNITDIDDKIIMRARQNHLVSQIRTSPVADIKTYFMGGVALLKKRFDGHGVEVPDIKDLPDIESAFKVITTNQEKLATVGEKLGLYTTQMSKCVDASEILLKNSSAEDSSKKVLELVEDVIAVYLDTKHGHEVTEHEIFQKLASYWESEYFKDMERLNIKPPMVVTRVSQYVDEIVEFVQKIISHGFAYESEGSIYFDVEAFKKAGFDYAKLEPWSAGHSTLMQEGEGALAATHGKRNSNDFALWKSSKPGEPFWESPWGKGRPGWHIECSAMAGSLLGSQMDIHSGGIDLCFPHHDNELAQSEAHYQCKQWVNYFLHSGHLHIEGQKMSKSLKNFVTIREALESYTSNQIRIMFLMHHWDSVLDYKQSSMQAAISVEDTINNFVQGIDAMKRLTTFGSKQLFDRDEIEITTLILEKKQNVHEALVDNVNTPVVISEILALINKCNAYTKKVEDKKRQPNMFLLDDVKQYVLRMMEVFGITRDAKSKSSGDVLPYLEVMSSFRSKIRDLARQKNDMSLILQECDVLRDDVLPELGVIFEDKNNQTLIKFGSKNDILKEKEKERIKDEEKKKYLMEQERRAQEKREKAKTKPSEMFKIAEFSKWDEKGIPTHDSAGEEIAKSRRKKLQKEYQQQEKLYQEFNK